MTNMTRRAALRGIALVSATGGAGAALAADPTISPLAGLITDYGRLAAEWSAAFEEVDQLEAVTELKPELVFAYNLLSWDETGEEVRTAQYFTSHEQIEAHFERNAAIPVAGAAEGARRQRIRQHAELADIKTSNRAAKNLSGLAAAEAKLDRLSVRYSEARDAVLAYRPQTVEEYRVKDAFIAREILSDFVLSEREQHLIFGIVAA